MMMCFTQIYDHGSRRVPAVDNAHCLTVVRVTIKQSKTEKGFLRLCARHCVCCTQSVAAPLDYMKLKGNALLVQGQLISDKGRGCAYSATKIGCGLWQISHAHLLDWGSNYLLPL